MLISEHDLHHLTRQAEDERRDRFVITFSVFREVLRRDSKGEDERQQKVLVVAAGEQLAGKVLYQKLGALQFIFVSVPSHAKCGARDLRSRAVSDIAQHRLERMLYVPGIDG